MLRLFEGQLGNARRRIAEQTDVDGHLNVVVYIGFFAVPVTRIASVAEFVVLLLRESWRKRYPCEAGRG
jgi:hypothetical protein